MIHIAYVHQQYLKNKVKEYRMGQKGPTKKTNLTKQAWWQDVLVTCDQYHANFTVLITQKNFAQLTVLINGYRDLIRAKQVEMVQNRQSKNSKIYSSILEEIPVLLTQHLMEPLKDSPRKYHLGAQKCLIRVCATPKLDAYKEQKAVDFAFAGYCIDLEQWIPLVGVEVKRYCDKTMHTTIVQTSRALADLRPTSVYCFLVEDEARGREVIENTVLVDREFLLTGLHRPSTDDEDDYDLNPFLQERLEHFYQFLELQIHRQMGLIKRDDLLG